MTGTLQGRSVLIVEDEFLILLDLQHTLENAGANVVTAASVAEGLRVAEKPVDVALLDVRLPDGEVFPVARKLAERHVPIVFHSGHAHSKELAADFPSAIALEKPAQEMVLVAAVTRQANIGGVERSGL